MSVRSGTHQKRLPEVLAVVGGGFAFRALAPSAQRDPVAGWAVRTGIAHPATRAIGEAAIRYFAAMADRDESGV